MDRIYSSGKPNIAVRFGGPVTGMSTESRLCFLVAGTAFKLPCYFDSKKTGADEVSDVVKHDICEKAAI